jgi:hypothetical protein
MNRSGKSQQNPSGATNLFEKSHNDIEGLTIVDPHVVFRGLNYGQWVAVWLNQLMSDQPDVQYSGRGKGMAFLRGNIEYGYKQDPAHAVFNTMTVENRLRILKDTAVFVPVMTTMFYIGETYQGQKMNDEISMRNTARRDTVDGGAIGATITVAPNNNTYPLVDDLNDFYVESPLFPLSVSENNPYKKTEDSTMDAGPYQSLTVGIFVIISHWPTGLFRLSVFGRGVGNYLSKSVYDIEVSSGSIKLPDISIKKPYFIPGLPKPPDEMNFTPEWGAEDKQIVDA